MRIERFVLSLVLALHTYVSESRADMASFSLSDYPDFDATGRASAYTRDELCQTAAQVAAANNLPVSFFTNLIHQESGFRTYVVSRAGARGIAQFMPKVAAEHGLDDPFEPASALIASGRLLAELVAQFGNLGLAAAAYNGGPRRVQEWLDGRGELPAETREYVFNITGYPADQWARGVVAPEAMPAVARCAELAFTTNVIRRRTNGRHAHNASPSTSMHSKTETPGIEARGIHRPLPRPSQFAVGLPVSPLVNRLERDYRRRATLAKRNEPALNRFLAMDSPKIMTEDKREGKKSCGPSIFLAPRKLKTASRCAGRS
jgi:hypothetical protein